MSRFPLSARIRALPPYLFAELDRKKHEVRARGVDIIDLGVGDPDRPTPKFIVNRLKREAEIPANHQYPSYEGLPQFRAAVAEWYRRRFGVSLDSPSEVVALIGSKEGIAHFPLAFVNPGDTVLVPDPGYPVYHIATMFAGGRSHFLPLRRENAFLPDFGAIPRSVLAKAKILFLNYPNNPTSAVADRKFYRTVLGLAEEHDLIVAHDVAYTEIYFDGKRPMSILELPGAKKRCIEFHSLSKTYNMTGWRIGFAVGNAELVAGIGKVKTNVDSGVFQAVQGAGIAALESGDEVTDAIRKTYQDRRDVLVPGLRRLGLDPVEPLATFYVWIPVPKGYTSASCSAHLLERAGIVTTPGNGFGKGGEGYIRIALTKEKGKLREALSRMRKVGF
ncbi:MAG TPA: LL-diaminopimelate aminotransferase [Candidatus Deferrimicrobiaceae bacterium]|jgi:LL-diaminopimelate aminotransferase|nr:LL-diaminopimelate aminotransferase [Candidatus Deferrimicrobiaceae bacterium]